MEIVLSGLTYESCLVFLDDVTIFGKTWAMHLERLKAVLDRLDKADLKLKPSKCNLFQERIHFLGRVITREGLQCDPEKVRAVTEWEEPKNLRDLRAFVGLASYYRSFIRGFAELARPLTELTRKGAPFVWTERQQRAFDALKHSLTTAPVLASPLDEGTYVLDTDASDEALGCVLQQEQEGQLKVIAYASRAVCEAERHYCTTRKELLAVIFGLKKFRQHLLGREFIIRSDHAALS